MDNLGVESYKSQIDSHCVFSSLHAQHLFRSGVPLYQTSSLPVTHTILHLYFLTHWLGAVTLTLRQGLTSPHRVCCIQITYYQIVNLTVLKIHIYTLHQKMLHINNGILHRVPWIEKLKGQTDEKLNFDG